MPHECTGCGRQFADGSKEMLSGCPDCDGTKFQFIPAGGSAGGEESPEPPERPGEGAGAVAETVGSATAKLRDFVGDDPDPPSSEEVGSRAPEAAAEGAPAAAADDESGSLEDGAQSAARSEMITQEELPGEWPDTATRPGDAGSSATEAGSSAADAGSTATEPSEEPASAGGSALGGGVGDAPPADESVDGDHRVAGTPSGEQPDLAQLREELNDQFEGIRISSPGQYELNLMELYEREETIIALQENGRYVIEPPESWAGE